MGWLRCGLAAVVGVSALIPSVALGDPLDAIRGQIAEKARGVLAPPPLDDDGLLTVAYGGIFVQCLSTHAPSWRCEAAGLRGQPWLSHVMTHEGAAFFAKYGFQLDPATGNYRRDLARTTRPEQLASLIVNTLSGGYGVDLADPEVAADLEIHEEWLLLESPCHLRMRANNVDGGALVTPEYGWENRNYADTSCSVAPPAPDVDVPTEPTPSAPPSSLVDLDAYYGAAIAAELTRLEQRKEDEDRYSIFSVSAGYIQCQADLDDRKLYCEAASADAVGPPLAGVLTPERAALLLKAGFKPPGRTMNFWRYYPYARYDQRTVAHALLAVLHDCYGYAGAPALMLSTESQPDSHPLITPPRSRYEQAEDFVKWLLEAIGGD